MAIDKTNNQSNHHFTPKTSYPTTTTTTPSPAG